MDVSKEIGWLKEAALISRNLTTMGPGGHLLFFGPGRAFFFCYGCNSDISRHWEGAPGRVRQDHLDPAEAARAGGGQTQSPTCSRFYFPGCFLRKLCRSPLLPTCVWGRSFLSSSSVGSRARCRCSGPTSWSCRPTCGSTASSSSRLQQRGRWVIWCPSQSPVFLSFLRFSMSETSHRFV